jgi:hypothetical protein
MPLSWNIRLLTFIYLLDLKRMQEKKANKLTRRDLALLKKVAKYYLQYKRVVDLGSF